MWRTRMHRNNDQYHAMAGPLIIQFDFIFMMEA